MNKGINRFLATVFSALLLGGILVLSGTSVVYASSDLYEAEVYTNEYYMPETEHDDSLHAEYEQNFSECEESIYDLTSLCALFYVPIGSGLEDYEWIDYRQHFHDDGTTIREYLDELGRVVAIKVIPPMEDLPRFMPLSQPFNINTTVRVSAPVSVLPGHFPTYENAHIIGSFNIRHNVVRVSTNHYAIVYWMINRASGTGAGNPWGIEMRYIGRAENTSWVTFEACRQQFGRRSTGRLDYTFSLSTQGRISFSFVRRNPWWFGS